MSALNDAIIGNTVSDWDALKSDMETSAAALGSLTGQANDTARLLTLAPVIEIANSLTAIVSDVKALKNNPQTADVVAQKIQEISDDLQAIIGQV
jgi:hypothetical protein